MDIFSSFYLSLIAFFVLRVINAFVISTFYVPDEYWQCQEGEF